MEKKALRRLQLKWYRKLRQSGFRDLEGTSDFNQFAVSTFRSQGGNAHLSWDFERDDGYGECMLNGWDGQSSTGESGNWEYYQRILDYANTLKPPSKTRTVLLAFLDKDPRRAQYKIPGISPRRAMSIWTETIKQLGLPAENKYYPPNGTEKPAPVRSLSKREIKALHLTPPRKIKG